MLCRGMVVGTRKKRKCLSTVRERGISQRAQADRVEAPDKAEQRVCCGPCERGQSALTCGAVA